MSSHDKETSKHGEAGGSAPMPVPPTSSEHEENKSGAHAAEHDSEYKPEGGSTIVTKESDEPSK